MARSGGHVVISMSLTDIAQALGAELRHIDDPSRVASDVVVDSRAVGAGALFVALPGATTDGHAFAAAAVEQGAIAAVVSAAFDGPAVVVDDTLVALGQLANSMLTRLPALRVIGITGSNGKTTTKDLVASVLGTVAPTVATPASYNGEVGLPLSVFQVTEETAFLVLEYGARGIGHIRCLTQIARTDIAVELGVGVAHIGEFGDRSAIATAKAELVEALEPGGLAVLNADDAAVVGMRDRTTARVRTFGRSETADVFATDVRVDTTGRAQFVLCANADRADVALQLYGEHQVTNALATACVAMECGLSLRDTAAALSAATPRSRWRMEVTETADGVTLVNDAYNANPDSMGAGLRALAAMAGDRRTWAVLGHMAELGDVSEQAHRSVGRLAAELGINSVVVVGAAASAIAEGAGASRTKVLTAGDVDEAI